MRIPTRWKVTGGATALVGVTVAGIGAIGNDDSAAPQVDEIELDVTDTVDRPDDAPSSLRDPARAGGGRDDGADDAQQARVVTPRVVTDGAPASPAPASPASVDRVEAASSPAADSPDTVASAGSADS